MELKRKHNISSKAFSDTRMAMCDANTGLPTVPSLETCHRRLAHLAGFKAQKTDCCINSCMSYAPDAFHSLESCTYCKQPRRDAQGRPRKQFTYIPFTPRLLGLYHCPKTGKEMLHRSKHVHVEGLMTDVYDSKNYRDLLEREVMLDGQPLGHCFFSDHRDVALGISTDGFLPFKNCRLTAWPVILFNYNLPPDVRFLLDHIICIGVIPGPKKPRDLDSFLWPLISEFLRLAEGVRAYNGIQKQLFKMHAYLILGTGDMPAVASLMRMLGHNAIYACRMCSIVGVRIPNKPKVTSHYFPLDRSRHPSLPKPAIYDAADLPLRSHEDFMRQAYKVQMAPTAAKEQRLATRYGIKGIPALSFLPSLLFPDSFQYGFMHLILENLIPNLVALWTDEFKDISGDTQYTFNPQVWAAIGEAGSLSGDTIPSSHGARVPNIAIDRSKFIADTWLFWTTHLGPPLLQKVFKHRRYYDHFVRLVRLVNTCLQFEITEEEVDELESGFINWVKEYEK
jgi:hypothetical protein